MGELAWYEVIQGVSLLQGDLLFQCPVFVVANEWPLPEGTAADIDIVETNVVVMTQSCDLENDKVQNVLLARLVTWSNLVKHEAHSGNPIVKSRDFRRRLIEGNVPGLSLLNKHDGSPILEWSVVDFHQLFTLPKAFVSQFANDLGPRLRLRSPYREHLAQAFARYFMRVGLPHDAKAFEKEGDVKV